MFNGGVGSRRMLEVGLIFTRLWVLYMRWYKERGKYLGWCDFHIAFFLLNVYFVFGCGFRSIDDAYH